MTGKYNYKSEDAEDGEQAAVFAGEFPTAYSSFGSVHNISINGGSADKSINVHHAFFDPTGVK